MGRHHVAKPNLSCIPLGAGQCTVNMKRNYGMEEEFRVSLSTPTFQVNSNIYLTKTKGRPLWKNQKLPYQYDLSYLNRQQIAELRCWEAQEERHKQQAQAIVEIDIEKTSRSSSRSSGSARSDATWSTVSSASNLRNKWKTNYPKAACTQDFRNNIIIYWDFKGNKPLMPGYTGYLPAYKAESVYRRTYADIQRACRSICNRDKIPWDGIEGFIRAPAHFGSKWKPGRHLQSNVQ